VKAHEILAANRLEAGDRAADLARIRMRAVERLREGISGHRRRVVFLLPDRRDQVVAPRLDLLLGKPRMPCDVGGEPEHRRKIIGQARRGDRHLVTAGRHRQRGAAAVEIVRDLVRRMRHRAAIQHARAERRRAVALGRIRVGAVAHADQRADRRRGVIGLGDDRDAVLERHPLGIQAGHNVSSYNARPAVFRIRYSLFVIGYFLGAAL
jgi:hypothetical protein